MLGLKVAYWAVGLGNLRSHSRRLKARLLLSMADHLSFRDPVSSSRAQKLVPWKTADMSNIVEDLSMPLLRSAQKQVSSNPYLLVAWRDLSRYFPENKHKIVQKLVPTILSILEEYRLFKVVLIDTDSMSDSLVSKELADSLSRSLPNIAVFHETDSDYRRKLELVLSASAVITSRLHVMMAADHFSIPCFVFPYSPKILYYAESSLTKNIFLIPYEKLS